MVELSSVDSAPSEDDTKSDDGVTDDSSNSVATADTDSVSSDGDESMNTDTLGDDAADGDTKPLDHAKIAAEGYLEALRVIVQDAAEGYAIAKKEYARAMVAKKEYARAMEHAKKTEDGVDSGPTHKGSAKEGKKVKDIPTPVMKEGKKVKNTPTLVKEGKKVEGKKVEGKNVKSTSSPAAKKARKA